MKPSTLKERLLTATLPAEERENGRRLLRALEPIRSKLEQVEAELASRTRSPIPTISLIGDYLVEGGGKRIRPSLLLLASRLLGYEGDRDVRYAAVVEFIHTATLVHDDIVDGAETRRGRLAAHSRWGNDITVLLGDYLYIRSMAMALTQDTLDVVRLLCNVTLRMIEGELYQLTKAGDVAITEDEHFEIIRRKTAYLFSGCAEIGALLGNATPDQRTALRDYGFNLGIAFQIVDDVLDYTADESALGKPIGGDLREGKITLPVILLLQRTGPEVHALVQEIVANKSVTPEAWRTIRDLLRSHGAVEEAFARAVTYGERARTHLRGAFPASEPRDGLLALVDYVLSRDR